MLKSVLCLSYVCCGVHLCGKGIPLLHILTSNVAFLIYTGCVGEEVSDVAFAATNEVTPEELAG